MSLADRPAFSRSARIRKWPTDPLPVPIVRPFRSANVRAVDLAGSSRAVDAPDERVAAMTLARTPAARANANGASPTPPQSIRVESLSQLPVPSDPTHLSIRKTKINNACVIPTEASRRFFFAFASRERVGSRSGGTLA